MTKLHRLDYFQIVTTVLFIALGAATLVHAALLRVPALTAYVFGAGLLGFGLYRATFVLRALRRRDSLR